MGNAGRAQHVTCSSLIAHLFAVIADGDRGIPVAVPSPRGCSSYILLRYEEISNKNQQVHDSEDRGADPVLLPACHAIDALWRLSASSQHGNARTLMLRLLTSTQRLGFQLLQLMQLGLEMVPQPGR